MPNGSNFAFPAADIAAQPFNLYETMIHPGQVALALLAFFGGWLASLSTLRDR